MEKNLLRLQDKITRLDSEYADFRYVELDRIKIRTQRGALDEVKKTHSRGIGFRVLREGTFGFSSTSDLSEKSLFFHLNQADQMAKQFSNIRHAEVKLVPVKPVKDKWQTPIANDPWALSVSDQTKPLREAEKLLGSNAWIKSTSGTMDFLRKRVLFVSSEGSWIEQLHYRTGGLISAESWTDGRSASADSEKVKRSWPGPSGLYRAQGYELIENFNFVKEAERLAKELKELRRAPEAPSGTLDLILKGSVLALQLHETFGHASESDRVYGYEDNFGGRTFLNPGLIGGLPVASPLVTITSDATPKAGPGAGSFAYDDEGVPAKRIYVLRKGLFQGYLTSRETAFFLNQAQSSANMVAEDWSHYPLIRMTNLNLVPGEGRLSDMIRDTQDGILIDNELSWSIDELRLDFQIGGEMGYRIRRGKIDGLVRFPIYHGNTMDFWRSCDRIAGPKEWDYWGFSDCGKGGPYQEAFTGHGVSPVRFRQVRFGRT